MELQLSYCSVSFIFLTTLALERPIDIFQFQVYVSYLVFQLFSHKTLYDDKARIESIRYTGPSAKDRTRKLFRLPLTPVKETKEEGTSEGPADSNTHIVNRNPDDDVQPGADVERRGTVATEDDDEDVEIPELSLPVTIILLIVVTVLVAVTAEWLVGSINGLADGGGISKEFIGLILLPIVGNAAEHATAVTVSVKDKLTLSLGVAVGSSIVSSPFVTGNVWRLELILISPANRLVCHPVHRHPRVDHGSSYHDALRPVRVDRPLPLRVDCQLRCARWKVELVRRNDLDMLVRLGSPLSCYYRN